MQNSILPLGKLPVELLQRLLERWPVHDPRVLIGPGIGIDCAVVDAGDKLMVFKTDPITFATDEIGWYTVQINSNDLATTGAAPRWFLAKLAAGANPPNKCGCRWRLEAGRVSGLR